MIRLNLAIDLRYEIFNRASDLVFNIHAARTAQQSVVTEDLAISPQAQPYIYLGPTAGAQFLRIRAEPGPLTIRYTATVDIDHHMESPALIDETGVDALPPAVLLYVFPSRYCQSDRLRRFAAREFGHLRQGYWRVQAIQDWVRSRTAFQTGSSNGSTSAVDTLIEQVGVCRDFAHLMIALCRAVNIPARFVTGIDCGADPALGPTDFHAYVEVFMGGRWYLFDPTGISPPMALVRIGTGRDAADVAFATLFGEVRSWAPRLSIHAVDDPGNGFFQPGYSASALSSMAEV